MAMEAVAVVRTMTEARTMMVMEAACVSVSVCVWRNLRAKQKLQNHSRLLGLWGATTTV